MHKREALNFPVRDKKRALEEFEKIYDRLYKRTIITEIRIYMLVDEHYDPRPEWRGK